MAVGQKVIRVDALEKVTGRAKYTADMLPVSYLIAKVLHSTVANATVKSIDVSQAEKIDGVVKIITCFDVPDIPFPTAGHPWSTETAHQDIANRKLLNTRVRYFGDDIAVVVADNEVSASRALKALKVEYEEYEPLMSIEDSLRSGKEGKSPLIHEGAPENIMKQHGFELGDYQNAVCEKGLHFFEGTYETQAVQHAHIEPPISFAYEDAGRIVVVSSTQIPHIVRRVVGQALGIDWGMVRVIKPYIGGGFGNKQDVLYEPLNAYVSRCVGGRCVKLEISREETFFSTRTRHAMKLELKTAVRADGQLVAGDLVAWSNQGAYASHGHAIVANAVNQFKQLYRAEKATRAQAYTVYTNRAAAGAMRAYGIPQASFAIESHTEDIATALNIDPVEFRIKNCMRKGYKDPATGITAYSDGLVECMEKGKTAFDWETLRKKYKNQKGNIRRGVGMAIFNYKTGVYPIALETAACRMVLNADGSVQLQMGATEIGQGADTIFSQMAAQSLSVPLESIHITSTQDTDITPFDTGAYASRQSYVSGKALAKTAAVLKEKILAYAADMLINGMAGETGTMPNISVDSLDILNGNIIEKQTKKVLLSLSDLALESTYSIRNSCHITAEETVHCTDNTFSFGACFVEIEVDIALAKIRVLRILNVHDSGTILNPALAEAQVHGGMSMSLGYGLSEQLLYNEKGKLLNDNLLDYKLPTSIDTPELDVLFVENEDPTGPFGNKALGEPPAIPCAPAIRNALLHATGVAVNTLPLAPQNLFEHFCKAGLIRANS
ncbi:MAG: xanthine dehydrogenase subunit XdhA [Spirochaetales bacterium]